ncbi:MAG: class I SAM-dependent methyltransferase [Bacteroidota bacterium]
MKTSQTGDTGWNAYYEFTRHAPPRDTLLKALAAFEEEQFQGMAVDLGCGNGRDCMPLLEKGWRVLAVDREAGAEHFIRDLLPSKWEDQFVFVTTSFEELDWPTVDFVNASYALPFCPRDSFEPLWQKMCTALRSGGRFAGHFLGQEDDWATEWNVQTHSRQAIDDLFAHWTLEDFREEQSDEKGLGGHWKHWHIYHVVARYSRKSG